jgi:CIC family chloride channel protein
MPLAIMALYLVGKFVATTLTLGSGGSGGIFTPTLYMGTMLGGAVGLVSQHLFPGVVGQFAGYALVGAATVFAAAARAPITAILIVMGVVVAFILIALYLPIFSMGSHGALG